MYIDSSIIDGYYGTEATSTTVVLYLCHNTMNITNNTHPALEEMSINQYGRL